MCYCIVNDILFCKYPQNKHGAILASRFVVFLRNETTNLACKISQERSVCNKGYRVEIEVRHQSNIMSTNMSHMKSAKYLLGLSHCSPALYFPVLITTFFRRFLVTFCSVYNVKTLCYSEKLFHINEMSSPIIG